MVFPAWVGIGLEAQLRAVQVSKEKKRREEREARERRERELKVDIEEEIYFCETEDVRLFFQEIFVKDSDKWSALAESSRHSHLWRQLFSTPEIYRDFSLVRHFYKIYLVRDMSSAAVESLWNVARFTKFSLPLSCVFRDKTRSHSRMEWLEELEWTTARG